jgi:hypothetical protein
MRQQRVALLLEERENVRQELLKVMMHACVRHRRRARAFKPGRRANLIKWTLDFLTPPPLPLRVRRVLSGGG